MSSKIAFNCETIPGGTRRWGVYYEGQRVGAICTRTNPDKMPTHRREEIASLFAQIATGEKAFFEVAQRILTFASF